MKLYYDKIYRNVDDVLNLNNGYIFLPKTC